MVEISVTQHRTNVVRCSAESSHSCRIIIGLQYGAQRVYFAIVPAPRCFLFRRLAVLYLVSQGAVSHYALDLAGGL